MIAIELVCLLSLFALSFFFSGTETVLFSLTGVQRQRLRDGNPSAAKLVDDCLKDSARLLSTLLVGNTLVNFAIATLGYRLLSASIPGGSFIAVPALTVALLVFGEITPKQVALRYAEELAPFCARSLGWWSRILSPCNALLAFLARPFAGSLERERRALSDEELLSVLRAGSERGDFDKADTEMIDGVLRLSELSANDEMTPRVDMETYDVDLPEAKRREALAAGHHRFLPVIRRTPDAIEGIYDRETGRIEDALFVPETVTLDDLLFTFQRSGRSLAVVTDEFGGTAGIISLDDVMELIFGPKVFTCQDNEPPIVRNADGSWTIDARASLDEVGRALDVELEAEDADRLSGWVAFHAERIPHVGQQIEADGCRATILKRRHRRVALVRMEVVSPPDLDTDEEILADTDEAVERTEEDL